MTTPTIVLKADLNDDGVFEEDWSSYLLGYSVELGRGAAVDRFSPRKATFLLDNDDSRFSPRNTAGPYSPNLVGGKRVQLTAQVTVAAVENILPNPSLETNTTGWAAGTGNAIAVSAVEARFGKQSLKCTWQTGGDPELAKEATTATAAAYVGSVYVWIPSDWDGGDIQLIFQGYGSATGLVTGTADSTITDRWQRVEAQVTPDAGDLLGSFDIKVASNPSNGKFIYIDAAMMELGSVASIYVDGDQPACTWSGTAHASSSDRPANPTFDRFTGELVQFNVERNAMVGRAEFKATGQTESLLRTLVSAGPFTRKPASDILRRLIDLMEGPELIRDGAGRFGGTTYSVSGGSTVTASKDTGAAGDDPVIYDALEGDTIVQVLRATGDGGWQTEITSLVDITKYIRLGVFVTTDSAGAVSQDLVLEMIGNVSGLIGTTTVTLSATLKEWVYVDLIAQPDPSDTLVFVRLLTTGAGWASGERFWSDCLHAADALQGSQTAGLVHTVLGTKWDGVLEYLDAFKRSAGALLRELAASVGGWFYENGAGLLVFEDYSQRDPAVVSIPKLRLSDVPEDGFPYVLKDFDEPATSLANMVKVGSFGDVHALPGPSDSSAKTAWSLEPAVIALAADEKRIFFADYVSEDEALGGLIARRASMGVLPSIGGWAADDGVNTPYVVNYGRSGEVVLKAPGGGLTVYRLLIGARVQNRQTTERAFITVGAGQPIMELEMPAQGLKTAAMTAYATWAQTKYSVGPATMKIELSGLDTEHLLEIFGRDVGLPVWVRHVQGQGSLGVDALFYVEGIREDYRAGDAPRLTLTLEEGT